MAKFKLSDRQLKEVSRPEILIEYESFTQLPSIIFLLFKFRQKKVTLRFMCGKTYIGEQKCVIKPKYRLKKVK